MDHLHANDVTYRARQRRIYDFRHSFTFERMRVAELGSRRVFIDCERVTGADRKVQ